MSSLKKTLLMGVALVWGGCLMGVEVNWDPSTTYIIPADGDIWYIDAGDGTVTLTDDLTISGTLEVRNGATLQNFPASQAYDASSDPNDITIGTAGVLDILSGGTVNVLGEHGGSVGSEIGNSATATNNGVINIDGILNLKGGNSGSSSGNFGGSSTIDGDGEIYVSGSLLLSAGNSVFDVGGEATINGDGKITIDGALTMNASSALLALGANTKIDETTTGARTVYIRGTLNMTGGNGSPVGNGGNAEIIPLLLVNLDTANVNLSPGDGHINSSGGNIILKNAKYQQGPFPSVAVQGNEGSDPNKGISEFGSFTIEISPGDDIFDCTDLDLTLSQDLYINYTWTISCDKNIWGNGNKIILGPNGEIIIDGNVEVSFNDLDIEDLNENSPPNLRCITHDEEITLNNVVLKQDGNYSFSVGKLFIDGDCRIDAPSLHFILSDGLQQFTILANATLKLLKNTTLEYDTGDPGLFVMTNNTSALHLHDAQLLGTQALDLANGVLITSGLGELYGIGQIDISGLSDIRVRGGLAKIGNVIWT